MKEIHLTPKMHIHYTTKMSDESFSDADQTYFKQVKVLDKWDVAVLTSSDGWHIITDALTDDVYDLFEKKIEEDMEK